MIQQEYTNLQEKLFQANQKNNDQEDEIREFQTELLQISDQSKEVEQNLVAKLHEISEKYQKSILAQEDYQKQAKLDKRKLDEIQFSVRDQQLYANALEKENYFLREEIEKAKFNKDKNEYSKFVSGLLPIRDKKANRLDESNG